MYVFLYSECASCRQMLRSNTSKQTTTCTHVLPLMTQSACWSSFRLRMRGALRSAVHIRLSARPLGVTVKATERRRPASSRPHGCILDSWVAIASGRVGVERLPIAICLRRRAQNTRQFKCEGARCSLAWVIDMMGHSLRTECGNKTAC